MQRRGPRGTGGPCANPPPKIKICERHGKKTGVFSGISQNILDRFSQSFHHMNLLWVQMIHLDLVFRFVKGRYTVFQNKNTHSYYRL